MQSSSIILAFALALVGCSGQKHSLPFVPHIANADCGQGRAEKTTVRYLGIGHFEIEVLCDDGQHHKKVVQKLYAAK